MGAKGGYGVTPSYQPEPQYHPSYPAPAPVYYGGKGGKGGKGGSYYGGYYGHGPVATGYYGGKGGKGSKGYYAPVYQPKCDPSPYCYGHNCCHPQPECYEVCYGFGGKGGKGGSYNGGFYGGKGGK